MKKFKVTVSSMTGSYTGYEYGNSESEVVERLRGKYKRNNDSRYSWNIKAREVR